jgi:serine/threonine-protein kinase
MTLRDDAFAATITTPTELADGLASTLAADGNGPTTQSIGTTLKATTRPAVLPRADSGDLPVDPGERYAKKRVLGAGGMGEVVLAEDRDIGRDVALKYLTAPSHDKAALARFTDEIRVVGSLEHPNIVPIHDVGVDENDRYYFVMKHVEGETLEQIIEKLAAGDPSYHARYTYTARVQMFVALLRALEFAHSRGYVHRDIKPANVMVGHYGEVMLMDWGVAKRRTDAENVAPQTHDDNESQAVRARLFTTRRGAIVGTPAYMSPEQARGDVDAIDERSDVYCASALFYELITLRYYLGSPQTLPALLDAIQNHAPDTSFSSMGGNQGPARAEFLHFIKKGLQKDPTARYQNVTEMIGVLEDALDGRVKVQCPFTLQKRMTRELSRFSDRHPVVLMNTLVLGSLGTIALVAWALFVTLHTH